MKRACRNTPLTENKQHNKMFTHRSIVERSFGLMKLHYGMAKARYRGLARNYMRFGLISMAHNIKRGVSVLREMSEMQDSDVLKMK